MHRPWIELKICSGTVCTKNKMTERRSIYVLCIYEFCEFQSFVNFGPLDDCVDAYFDPLGDCVDAYFPR